MPEHEQKKAESLQKQAAIKTDRVIFITAVIGLVLCVAIQSFTREKVPELVFWILGAAIVPDAINIIRGQR